MYFWVVSSIVFLYERGYKRKMTELGHRARQALEEKALLSGELLRRRQGDPLTLFDLFSPQREFVTDILSKRYKEYYYIGANRSGKSDAGAVAGATLARFGYRGTPQEQNVRFVGGTRPQEGRSSISVRDFATSGWVSALDFPISRDTIQPKYFDNGFTPPNATHEPFIPKHEIHSWRVSDGILKLKNGSIIGFKSADSGRTKYQGAEKDWIHFDEEHPKSIYDEALIRVGKNPLHIFTTCTLLPPEGMVGGVTWIFNEIVKPWKRGMLENAEIYNASIYDNPHIPRSEIEFLESKYPEGSDQRRIRLNGELIGGIGGSRIYSGFHSQLNVKPQKEVATRRPLAWIWDFNVEPMVSLIGQRNGPIFRVFQELILEEANIPEMCNYFRRVHPVHQAPIWLYGDATGQARSAQTKKTSYQIILNEMAQYPVPLFMKVPEKNPGVTDRVNAVNVACSGPQGQLNLEIDPDCDELITDLEQVLGDGKQGIKKTFNKKDPYFKRTHTSDALGYWIAFEAPVANKKWDEQAPRSVKMPRPSYHRN
jgi:phage terminase large subunit-like protein